MILTTDIAELWDTRSYWHAVQVVKHDYKTKAPQKFLGARNEDYPCKNWSSVMLWNCGHYTNRTLIPEHVEKASGEYLHRFKWIPADRIGELDKDWNWLATEYPDNEFAKLIHYTLGTPCFADYKASSMSAHWFTELNEAMKPFEPG